MSESTSKGSSASTTIINIVVGIALMAGGTYLSNQGPLPLEKTLQDIGIPVEIGKTVATIGVFLILFKVIDSFFFKPLKGAIDGRTNELESTFSEAESLRTEMSEMKSSYEIRLVETEAQAREQIQAQIKEAQDLKKQLMADAQKQADDYKQSALKEIDAEKNKAITELRVNVANLSLQATEKILGENVDTDRNRKLIDEFLDNLEVKV